MSTAADSSVIIDTFEPDPEHGPSSRETPRRCLREGSTVASGVAWAEVLTAFGHAHGGAVEALRQIAIGYSPMTGEAALRAAECWYRFRKRSGGKERIAADFLIGGHAPARIIHEGTVNNPGEHGNARSCGGMTPGGRCVE